MDRRRFVLTSLTGALAVPVAAGAQQADRVYRLGFIVTGARQEVEHLTRALDEELQRLGYVTIHV